MYNAKKYQVPVSEMGKMMQRKREQDLYLAAQNGNTPIKKERFEDAVHETSEPLEMPSSSPIADVPQQQVGSKRAYHDINEQQPMFKRQRLQEVRRGLVPKVCRGKTVLRQEQNDLRAAAENGESPSSSVSSSSSKEEAAQIKMAMNRQESSPVETSDMLPVADKVTDEGVTHLEGENDGSSSFTQKESLEDSSSEEHEDDYSSGEEEEAVQIPAVKEALQEQDNMKVETTIQSLEENSEPSSSSSSEDESSEEESDDEPEEPRRKLFTKEEPPKEPMDNSKELIQLSDDESSNSSSEDESEDEESEDEPEEQLESHLAPEAFPQDGRERMVKAAVSTSLDQDNNESKSSSSSSEDESSEEGSEDEPEEPKKQPATKVEPQKRRKESPEEPIQITSDESSSESSEDES